MCVAPLDVNGKCVMTHARDAWSCGGAKRGKEEIAGMLRARGLVVVKSPFDSIWMVEDETILNFLTNDL